LMWRIQVWHANNLRVHGPEVEQLLQIARDDSAHG